MVTHAHTHTHSSELSRAAGIDATLVSPKPRAARGWRAPPAPPLAPDALGLGLPVHGHGPGRIQAAAPCAMHDVGFTASARLRNSSATRWSHAARSSSTLRALERASSLSSRCPCLTLASSI
eukprot:scaffold95260_cov63-Phaeocystis_antarctica.AAC.1